MSTALADPLIVSRVNAQHGFSRARAVNLLYARQDAHLFNLMVLRDEETGRPVAPGPVHERWHKVLDAHDRVVMWSHVEAGKTNQISVGRSLFELGKNPNLRIACISSSMELARKIVRSSAQYIEKSPELRSIFPQLVPARDRSLPWTAQAFTVQRDSYAKDPSFQACGLHGSIIGSRIDLLILDDILSQDNTHTEASREDAWRWVRGTLLGRLTQEARVWALGNAWHPRDAMHLLAELQGYYSQRFPVLDPETGESTWPGRWSLERIESKRQELGPLESGRALFCLARDEEESVFKREWIDTALDAGDGYELVDSLDSEEEPLPPGYFVVTGVDLASRKTESADLTCLFTVLVHPDGKKQVLSVQSGRMAGPEIVKAIDDTYARFGGIVAVENNAAQEYILQFARKVSPAVLVPFTTGKNKVHPEFGILSVGAEMAGGQWIIPSAKRKTSKEVSAWVSEMLFYNPREHTGDRLMASWFARECARRVMAKMKRKGDVSVRVVG